MRKRVHFIVLSELAGVIANSIVVLTLTLSVGSFRACHIGLMSLIVITVVCLCMNQLLQAA